MYLEITRKHDIITVAIFKFKEEEKYSYINLTKRHICPCKFDSIEDALEDLKKYDDIVSYQELDQLYKKVDLYRE